MPANLNAPLPDGPFAAGQGTPAADVAQLTAALQQAQAAGLADAADITAAKARANHTGTQGSSTISDFAEAVQDVVGAMVGGVSGVTVSYNDTANTLTITGPGGVSGSFDVEAARDALGTALVGVGNIAIAVNDAADTITISTTATANSTDAQLRDRSTHTGAQAISTVTGLQAALDGKLATVAAGPGVTVQAAGSTVTVGLRYVAELPSSPQVGDIVFIAAGGTTPPTDTTAPAVPTSTTETGLSATGVTLDWASNTDDTDHYLYRYGTTNPPTGTGTSVTASQAVLTGLTSSTAYYWQVRAVDAAGNQSAWTAARSFTTSTVSSGPTTIASDDFNRADSSGLGTTPVGGKTWTDVNLGGGSGARFDVVSNRARIGSFGGSDPYASYLDLGTSTYTISADFPGVSDSGIGVLFRYVDPQNWWAVTDRYIRKWVNGSLAQLIDRGDTEKLVAGDHVDVIVTPTTITVKRNGAASGAVVTDSVGGTATKGGMYLGGSSLAGLVDAIAFTTP